MVKVEEIKDFVQSLKSYYEDGVMCSLNESIHGESVCNEILEHIKLLECIDKEDVN